MTAKEFLEQARMLDHQINNKLEEMVALRSLAMKATTAFGGVKSGSAERDVHSREKIICRIMDMENEINADIDRLLDIKSAIKRSISLLPDMRQRVVLEKHYLCYMSWDDVAADLGYSVNTIYDIHRKALADLKFPEKV